MDLSVLLIPVLIYTGLNVLAFAVFFHDKLMAKLNRRRISENLLLLLAALGPVGALIAMAGFRHKTRHVKFFLVTVFAFLHLLVFVRLWHEVAG
jgi:uncharacterized membrane protein YsdA (DUF1294 family)